MRVNIGGVWKDVSAIKVNVAGTWRTVTRLRTNIAGTWKEAGTFIPPLSVTVNNDAPFGRTFGTNPVTTLTTTTLTPSGGLAPFTYSWVRQSGSGSPTTPALASTNFTETVADYDTKTGVFRGTVTDALGSTAYVDVTATFTNLGPA